MASERCACGWRRPLIAVSTREGETPREAIVLAYFCPCCGNAHVCGERDPERARTIFMGLIRELGDPPATFTVD